MPHRAYAINSRALLYIAREARDRSADAASQAIVAVTFSAIGLESFVNEIIERVAIDDIDVETPELKALRTMIIVCDLNGRRISFTQKVNVIYAALTGHPIPRDTQPCQDFDLLIAARNFIVHDRPESVPMSASGGRHGDPAE